MLFLLQLVCNVVMWTAGAFGIYRLNEYWLIDSRNMWRAIDQLDAHHQPTASEGGGDGEERTADE